MSELTSAQLAEAIGSQRFAALRRLDLRIDDLRHWDPELDRDPRLLVPVDVQALVVREGDDETMLRLPLRDGTDPAPSLDDRGAPRTPGVHLLWSVPEALGRGRIVDDPDDPDDVEARRLELPVLPDRWAVIRLVVPTGARRPRITGWVVEADAGTVTPMSDWPDDRTATLDVADPIPADRLDVQVGGPSWTTCYDAALGRLSLHDPLDDLTDDTIDGVEGDALCYVVAGWWSTVEHDPLNGIGSLDGYWERLASLGWDDVDHPASFRDASSQVERVRTAAAEVGVPYATRFGQAVEQFESARYEAIRSRFVDGTGLVSVLPQPPTRATLLHGRIHGIPMRADRPDNRPDQRAVGVALAPSPPELTSTLAASALRDTATPSERRDLERVVAGLGAGLLPRMSESDMWAEIEHDEHRHGFGSLPGGTEALDRFVPAPPKSADPRRTPTPRGPRSKHVEEHRLAGHVMWSSHERPAVVKAADVEAQAARKRRLTSASSPTTDQADFRTVPRAAPRFHFPTAPVLAVSGAGRERSAVERDEADGVLRCRTSDQVSEGLEEMLDARDLVPTIGTGAVPDELRLLAREALADDPHLTAWRSRVSDSGQPDDAVFTRMRAEASVNYAYYAADDELLGKVVRAPVSTAADRQLAVEHLLRHSVERAVWTHPEGVTMWGQPWRPVFCEWTVDVDLASPRAWTLGATDLERSDADVEPTETITISGRSPVADGVAGSLQAAVDRWLGDERARDRAGRGLASRDVEHALAGLTEHLTALDLVSVALDGIRERLLGLVYDRGLVSDDADRDEDGRPRTRTDRPPELIVAGRLTLRAARLVDAFGRLLDLPIADAVRPVRSAGVTPGSLQLRPRLTTPARLRLRLVDPLALGSDAATAVVDQTVPSGGVSPIAGFLLPDHIDESLEIFSPAGTPLGQVFHDGFSGAVTWEGAPGRTDVGPGAGPLDDGVPSHRRVGWIASGLVVHDATARQLSTDRTEAESSLSAMLHAIDTTLWTVDPFGSLGREHIAGLVGRPIAVVTTQLTLDVMRDLDEHVYVGTTREERELAFREIAATPFEVRLGAVSRADDGLLGYFVDDDYSRFFVVDRVIAEQSVAGRGPIESDYIVPDGTITIRHGQTLRLTLLMHPGGKVHLTSGVLPRQTIALSREWVHRGLSNIAPSARVGPLLIDAEKVRLPKIAAFPADQLFTRRDSPASWRDDPIVSATHTAYLPDQASVVQEGWIRIAPEVETDG